MTLETWNASEEVQATGSDDLLINLDPFSIFLGIAGFLGSVASIAGYIEFRRQQRQQTQEQTARNLRDAKDLIMSLEVDTMQVETSLKKLEFVLEQGTAEQRFADLENASFRFGSVRPLFTLQGFNTFDDILLEINRLVGRCFENISRLLQRLYNLNVQFEQEIYEDLVGLQNKLNSALRGDLSYQEGFRIYYEIIVFTRELLRRIRIRISEEF